MSNKRNPNIFVHDSIIFDSLIKTEMIKYNSIEILNKCCIGLRNFPVSYS